jgi:beta-galactosidase
MARQGLQLDHLTMGVCYYPEHWDERMWEDDLRRMRGYGIEVVRIAEFAWNQFEMQEGCYTFDLFDRFMELALREQMKVIFCTPTATAPAWMSEKYPEILNSTIDGELYRHGTRRHNNLNSPKYRDFSAKITEKLAEHYSAFPNLIGWQLDNEINCENDLYYSESDHQAFRDYMKRKFGSLDRLNKEMGTVFWNQIYTDWDQIHLTRRTNTFGQTNPHMQLEEKRFISETVIGYFKLQADIIKRYRREDQFLTTNGLFRHVDYQKLTEDILDFITYDSYPNFAFSVDLDPEQTNGMRDRNSSNNLTYARSISKVFGIMEQQSGGGGWNCSMVQSAPKPGQMRLWTLQSIAHGADYVSYFRWRTCAFGTEMYWRGLNDPSNRPNRRLAELELIYQAIQKIGEIVHSEYQANVAILRDYDNEWDGEQDLWHGRCRRASEDAWFCSLQKHHVPFDYYYLEEDTNEASESEKKRDRQREEWKKYTHLVYCHPAILTEERVRLLTSYVENGGTLILGCRTGYKKINGQHTTEPLPGEAAKLCGLEVLDYTPLSKYDGASVMQCDCFSGKEYSAPILNEVLEATDGEVVGVFGNQYYAGKPAVVKNQVGKGSVYYFASAFGEDTAELACELTGIRNQFASVMEIPKQVELAVREKNGAAYLFLLNYQQEAASVEIRKAMTDLLSGKTIEGACMIEGYGCMVLKTAKIKISQENTSQKIR